MLTVGEKGILQYRYIVSDGEKEMALRVTGALPREGEMEIGGNRFRIYRERCFSGSFTLEKNGIPIANALRPHAFRDHFIAAFGDLEFELNRGKWTDSGLTVRWKDAEIGTIIKARKEVHALIDLPDTLDPELQIFFLPACTGHMGPA